MNDDVSLIETVRNNILFSGIDDDVFLLEFSKKLESKMAPSRKILYFQGNAVDGLYLIKQGVIEVYFERDNERYIISHAENNHLVGEFLLIGDSVRSTNAKVIEAAEFLFLSVDSFNELMTQFPDQTELIGTKIVNRICWNQTTLALRLSHLFIGMNESVVRCLINELAIACIPSNTLLFKQNDLSNDLCIIIDGQFYISRGKDDNEFLGVAGRGETIGEIGVICQTPREANVRAIRDSTVARLSRDSFERILQLYPLEINQTFVKSVINHMKKQFKRHIAITETFVLAILSTKIPKYEIIKQLVRCLSEHGMTISITSEFVDSAFRQKGVAQITFDDSLNPSLLQWLAEEEMANRYILFVLDDSMSNWSQRCLRQADHVIFFADANSQSEVSQFEQQIQKNITNKVVKKTLIINHEQLDKIPSNTVKWLENRDINIHHHVRNGVKADYSRVGRFLTGNAIGLVLGGGGARGFAHIGVIRAFQDLNIPIDLIGGNSMGAVIAAQFAMQWTHRNMMDITKAIGLKGDSLTIPLMSLFSGKKLAQGLSSMFANYCIEDLWLHFYSISCNISRAKVKVHDKGGLFAAVLSSNTPPGLLPPQVIDGDLLVDGALLNNVPVDIMAKRNEGGIIIAVDVSPREDLLDNAENIGGMSGWKLLFNKLNPFAEKISMPNMIEILTRAGVIGGLAHRKSVMEGVADLYLQPPVKGFTLKSFKEAELIEEVGYIHAMEKIQQWLVDSRRLDVPLQPKSMHIRS